MYNVPTLSVVIPVKVLKNQKFHGTFQSDEHQHANKIVVNRMMFRRFRYKAFLQID